MANFSRFDFDNMKSYDFENFVLLISSWCKEDPNTPLHLHHFHLHIYDRYHKEITHLEFSLSYADLNQDIEKRMLFFLWNRIFLHCNKWRKNNSTLVEGNYFTIFISGIELY
jgi:hypothetical protein